MLRAGNKPGSQTWFLGARHAGLPLEYFLAFWQHKKPQAAPSVSLAPPQDLPRLQGALIPGPGGWRLDIKIRGCTCPPLLTCRCLQALPADRAGKIWVCRSVCPTLPCSDGRLHEFRLTPPDLRAHLFFFFLAFIIFFIF